MSSLKPSNTLSFEDTQTAYSSKTDPELYKALIIFRFLDLNWLVKLGTFLLKIAISVRFPIDKLVEKTLFGHFCGGVSIKSCHNTIQKLATQNVQTILDYSVEGEDTEEDFDKTYQEILKTITFAASEAHSAYAVFKISGIGSSLILTKIQSKIPLSEEENTVFAKFKNRFEDICQTAYNQKVKLLIDAEETWFQDVIDDLVTRQMQKFNTEKAYIFNTIQMYRTKSMSHLISIAQKSENENFKVGVKLVRGAYMEKERNYASERGLEDPIYPSKEKTDQAFDQALEYMLNRLNIFEICLGTHNENSCHLCVDKMVEKQIESQNDKIWFAQLLGMGDHISVNLAKNGFNVAKYVPYGPILSVLPYLVRRAEENTAIEGQSNRELKLLTKEYKRRRA